MAKVKASTTTYKAPDVDKLDLDAKNNLKEFTDLLNSISSAEDKKKSLWRQIYENAIADRNNAYILFGDLCAEVITNATEHAIHGQTLAKYLERMEKSNAQLIKLAEMISEASEKDEVLSEDDMYDQIIKSKN